MTLLLPPPSAHEPERERGEAVDGRAAPSAASRPTRPTLDAWSCGLDPSDPVARDNCRDIVPELMVELL